MQFLRRPATTPDKEFARALHHKVYKEVITRQFLEVFKGSKDLLKYYQNLGFSLIGEDDVYLKMENN